MLTVLLITNIALVGMLVHTQKKIKWIAKEIDDIGSNLAYIQSNTVEIGTNLNEVQKGLEAKIETSTDEIKNASVKLTEIISNQISKTMLKLDSAKDDNKKISEVVINTQVQINKSKDEIVKEFNEAYKKAIAYPPALMFFKK